MSIEDLVVATVREEVCDNKLPVNTARISRRIAAGQHKMFGRCHEASDDDSLVDLGKGVAEKEPQKEPLEQTAAGPNAEGDSYDRTEKEAIATPPGKVNGRGNQGSGYSVSPGSIWSTKGTRSLTRYRDQRQGPLRKQGKRKSVRTYDQLSTPNATSEVGLPRPVNRRGRREDSGLRVWGGRSD